jgi:MATE family multidrug resistance protein
MEAVMQSSSSEERLKREVARDDGAATPGRPQAASGYFPKLSFLTPASATTRELVALAWPIAAAMLGETALGLVDTKLVGGLGAAALGGVGVATTTMFLAYALVYGLMRGVKVRSAHAIGEGRAQDGFAYARAGVVTGAALGAVVMLASRDVGWLLTRIGIDPEIAPHASAFLAAVTLGAPSTCALAALIQHRQAIGDSRTPMVIGIAGNIFNASLAWTLIYGHFGAPALGVRGAGYATAVTETLELAVMLVLLVRLQRRSGLRATLRFGAAAREVADLGVPLGLQFLAEMLAFATFTAVLGAIGKNEIAAHHVALNVIRVSFLPGLAVAEAASVLVGRALGARNAAEADRAAKSAVVVAVGFMAACGVVFGLFGGPIARAFSDDPRVALVARRLLWVASVFQVLDAVNMVFRGALRGAKDVRVVALFGIGVVWTCVPTAAYVFGKLGGLGALGGWLGFIAETTIGALVFWLRWRRCIKAARSS